MPHPLVSPISLSISLALASLSPLAYGLLLLGPVCSPTHAPIKLTGPQAVHSGADLHASASAARGRIPQSAQGYVGHVLSHVGSSQVLPLIEAAVEARSELAPVLSGSRELLYLDLALEDQVRQAAERGVGSAGFGAAALMRPLLQNLCLTLGDNEEACFCLKAWQELPASVQSGGRPNREEALKAVAVVNRIRRAITAVSDHIIARIGDVSKAYGNAFGVESWAVDLFAEEVVRGGPAFAISLVISAIDPVLRGAAALGAWQVISPATVTGRVLVQPGLADIQDKVFEEPTVLVAQHVSGEEEIPEGAVAVLTPDAPDVLSHVSVRARNMRVLFATCHEDEPLGQIRAAEGQLLSFSTTAAGAVTWSKAPDAVTAAAAPHAATTSGADDGSPRRRSIQVSVPQWCGKWVLGMDGYGPSLVGAKSKNLAGLRGRLPSDIALPSSVTLPFGVFEAVLDLPENRQVKASLQQLLQGLADDAAATAAAGGGQKDSGFNFVAWARSVLGSSATSDEYDDSAPVPAASRAFVLAKCRQLAASVTVPPALVSDLSAAMRAAGIPVPESEERWQQALAALKGVWASKYNERAYYSMKKVGLNFDSIRMAVLVQRVVPAKYAFVIHTKNPSNNNAREVFCELVLGLGESLVSGMVPGSSVAFKADKSRLDEPEVLCYASKGEAMFVRESLIFRRCAAAHMRVCTVQYTHTPHPCVFFLGGGGAGWPDGRTDPRAVGSVLCPSAPPSGCDGSAVPPCVALVCLLAR